MSAHRSQAKLGPLVDTILDVSLGLAEYLKTGKRPEDLDQSLLSLTGEVDVACLRKMNIDGCVDSVDAEYDNLMKILSHRDDGDLAKAKAFCILLGNRALHDAWDDIHQRNHR